MGVTDAAGCQAGCLKCRRLLLELVTWRPSCAVPPRSSFSPLPFFHRLILLSTFFRGSHTPNDMRLLNIKMHTSVVLAFLLLPIAALAVPLGLEERSGNDQDTRPVSAQEISSKFVRPARFAQIAYCPSNLVQTWKCGNSCQALGLGGFTPLTVGGGAFSLLNY